MNIYKVMFHNSKAVSATRITWDAQRLQMVDGSDIGINWLVVFAGNEQESINTANLLLKGNHSVLKA